MDTIREVAGHKFCFVGQLVYEQTCGDERTLIDSFGGVGVRLYRDLGADGGEYLCVESAETGEERWYRVDEASLAPVDCEQVKQSIARPR